MDIEMVSILLTRVRTQRVIGKLGVDLQCLQDIGLRVLGYRHLAFQPLISQAIHSSNTVCLSPLLP